MLGKNPSRSRFTTTALPGVGGALVRMLRPGRNPWAARLRRAACETIRSKIQRWARASVRCGALSVRIPPPFLGTSNWT